MTSPVVEIDARALVSRDKFHATFAETFGFFEGYGRNMDAWIDCMGYLRKRHSGMTQFHIGADQTLTIRLNHHEVLRDEASQRVA